MPTVNVWVHAWSQLLPRSWNLFVGSACNDNNAATINDAVNANWECMGTPDPNFLLQTGKRL